MGLECREMVRIESPARVGNRKMETEARTKGKVRGAETSYGEGEAAKEAESIVRRAGKEWK